MTASDPHWPKFSYGKEPRRKQYRCLGTSELLEYSKGGSPVQSLDG